MSERQPETAPVGTGHEHRFATLAEPFEFLVTDAAGGPEGAGGNAGISDMP